MASRAFARALVKGTRRPVDVFVQAPAALRHGCQMPQLLHRLPGNNRGVPHVSVFQTNLTKQRSLSSTVANSADASVNTTGEGTVGGSFDQRFTSLTSIGDCVNKNELRLLLEKNSAPVCYVWCDPSPCMHITQGISVAMNVNKLIKAGCTVKVLMADWLARMDRKIGGQVGGDLGEMKTVGLYNAEVWRAAGMDLEKVELVWLSDGIIRSADVYWPLTMHIAMHAYHTMAHRAGEDNVRGEAAGVYHGDILNSTSDVQGDGVMAAGLPARSPESSPTLRTTSKETVSWRRGCRCVARRHPQLQERRSRRRRHGHRAAGAHPGIISNTANDVQGDGVMAAGLPVCSTATSSTPGATFKETASWPQGCRRAPRHHLQLCERRPRRRRHGRGAAGV
ncbi:hypothetical protein ACQ4PT_062698 [Festuca glaucescens]